MKIALGTCVLAGNLNPAILRPDWLVKNKVLPDGAWTSELGLGPAGVSMKFTMADLSWTAGLERLQVEATSEKADPGAFVAEILKHLSHTPVRAVGNNFQADVSERKVLSQAFRAEFLDQVAGGDTLVSTTVGLKVNHGDAIVNLNLTFNASSDLQDVRLNFHRDVKDADAAIRAARNWSDDRNEALKLGARIELIKW